MPNLTYNDVLSTYADYPAPIRPYLLRAETHPALRSMLTKSFMRVMVDILARAPIAEPDRPLKLRVDIVAADLDISTKTVTRTLNLLRKLGWLRRQSGTDGRNNWGEFCCSEFVLGDELRSMLGLPIANAVAELPAQKNSEACNPAVSTTQISPGDSNDQHVDNASNETKMSDGPYMVNKVFLKEASFSKDASMKKTNPTPNIPAELADLHTQLGISLPGICSLMKLAGQVKQRLQDVWIAKRDQLLSAGVKEGRAYKYIKFLLECGEDFSFVARSKAVTRKKSKGQSPATGSRVDVRLYQNKKYQGTNGLRVNIHGDGSATISSNTRQEGYICPSDMADVYEAIKVGNLWLIEE